MHHNDNAAAAQDATTIHLDSAMQALDGNAQTVILGAARQWLAQMSDVPADAASPDAVRLLRTATDGRATTYEIEIDLAGTIHHVNVALSDGGAVTVSAAE